MCNNYLVNTLVLSTVHTMLMSKLNCINCLTNMRASLVQLGLKGSTILPYTYLPSRPVPVLIKYSVDRQINCLARGKRDMDSSAS